MGQQRRDFDFATNEWNLNPIQVQLLLVRHTSMLIARTIRFALASQRRQLRHASFEVACVDVVLDSCGLRRDLDGGSLDLDSGRVHTRGNTLTLSSYNLTQANADKLTQASADKLNKC